MIKKRKTIIKVKELAERLGVSRTTIWRWTKSGILPKPFSSNGVNYGYSLHLIKEWEKERR